MGCQIREAGNERVRGILIKDRRKARDEGRRGLGARWNGR